MLVLARKKNERILIGDHIEISVIEVKGDQVKLGIKAPKNVSVYRHEVYEAIQQENMQASRSAASLPDFSAFQQPEHSADNG